jgi:hypothetical protein
MYSYRADGEGHGRKDGIAKIGGIDQRRLPDKRRAKLAHV